MKLASHLQRSRYGIYYFRLVVPQSLRGPGIAREIKRSLNTRDPVVARQLAYVLSSKKQQLLERWLNGGTMLSERAKKLITPLSLVKRKNGDLELNSDDRIPEEREAMQRALRDPEIQKLFETVSGTPSDRSIVPIKLDAALEIYLNSPRVKKFDIKTLGAVKLAHKRLTQWVSDKGVIHAHDVTRSHIVSLSETLQNGNEALGFAPLSPTSVTKELSMLHGLFGYLRDFGHVSQKDLLPTAAIKVFSHGQLKKHKLKNSYQEFTDVEIKRLFNPETFLTKGIKPHNFWIPLIGLYTGARIEEIAQLKLDDIVECDLADPLTDAAANIELRTVSSRTFRRRI